MFYSFIYRKPKFLLPRSVVKPSPFNSTNSYAHKFNPILLSKHLNPSTPDNFIVCFNLYVYKYLIYYKIIPFHMKHP